MGQIGKTLLDVKSVATRGGLSFAFLWLLLLLLIENRHGLRRSLGSSEQAEKLALGKRLH